jgi:4a-hydroxytetrahydrobiopterin dehydratase
MPNAIIGNRNCKPCEGGVEALDEAASRTYLEALDGWALAGSAVEKTFRFANHYEAVAFVNAVAWISHREGHHPEITLGYADCRIRYWTLCNRRPVGERLHLCRQG